MNCREFNQNHDLRMKEIIVLGTLGKCKLPGDKIMELFKIYKTAESHYGKGLLSKREYMDLMGRIIKQAKGKNHWTGFKNVPFDKLPEDLKQETAEDFASHNI
jgi:hypothetical protein